VYKGLCDVNNIAPENESIFSQFTEYIVAIASELPIPLLPRPEQLAQMFLLLHSKK
jgi:hypothetical protein